MPHIREDVSRMPLMFRRFQGFSRALLGKYGARDYFKIRTWLTQQSMSGVELESRQIWLIIFKDWCLSPMTILHCAMCSSVISFNLGINRLKTDASLQRLVDVKVTFLASGLAQFVTGVFRCT